MGKILFALPCAGGCAENYNSWKRNLKIDFENIDYVPQSI